MPLLRGRGSPRGTGQDEVLLHSRNIFGLQEYHPRKLPQIPAGLSALLRLCTEYPKSSSGYCVLVDQEWIAKTARTVCTGPQRGGNAPLGIENTAFSSGSLGSLLVYVEPPELPELFARLLKPGRAPVLHWISFSCTEYGLLRTIDPIPPATARNKPKMNSDGPFPSRFFGNLLRELPCRILVHTYPGSTRESTRAGKCAQASVVCTLPWCA